MSRSGTFRDNLFAGLFLDEAQRMAVGVPDHHCFFDPGFPCASGGMATTLELMNGAPAWRNRPASAWIFRLTSVGCQCQRSLDLVSPGITPPPGGGLHF